jgi:hypothetical protein
VKEDTSGLFVVEEVDEDENNSKGISMDNNVVEYKNFNKEIEERISFLNNPRDIQLERPAEGLPLTNSLGGHDSDLFDAKQMETVSPQKRPFSQNDIVDYELVEKKNPN